MRFANPFRPSSSRRPSRSSGRRGPRLTDVIEGFTLAESTLLLIASTLALAEWRGRISPAPADLASAAIVALFIGLVVVYYRSRRRVVRGLLFLGGDRLFLALTFLGAVGVIAILVTLAIVLYNGAKPTIQLFGFAFLYTRVWEPAPTNVYGVLPMTAGTLITSGVALLIGVPLSIGAAIFLTQQAPRWLSGPVGQVIELLAAIPSIIYGLWGLVVLVPIMRYHADPLLVRYLGWTGWFGGSSIGLDVLTAGLVLSVMTIPTITAVSRDSMAAVPHSQKEAALSLGATPWEVTRTAVLPYASGGIVGGVVLGLGRALGETMAVTLVIGNFNQGIPRSLLGPGQTIASLIANQFTEASGPIELSALLEAGLVLLLITLIINVGARAALARFQSGQGAGSE